MNLLSEQIVFRSSFEQRLDCALAQLIGFLDLLWLLDLTCVPQRTLCRGVVDLLLMVCTEVRVSSGLGGLYSRGLSW